MKIYKNSYEERLYSTGNDELDDLLEKAFCDGYEYAQREFARRDYEGLSSKEAELLKQKRSDYAEYLMKNYRSTQRDIKGLAPGDIYTTNYTTRGGGIESTGSIWTSGSKKQHMNRVTDNMLLRSKEAKGIMRENAIQEAMTSKDIKKIKKAAGKIVNGQEKEGMAMLGKLGSKAKAEKQVNRMSKAGKAGRIAAIALPVAAAGIGTGIAIKNHKNKKQEQEN